VDPSNPLSFAIPLGGIALVLLAVVLAGGRRRLRLDETLAARRLAEDLPGFAVSAMLVDQDGNTVLARGPDGFAVVFARRGAGGGAPNRAGPAPRPRAAG
jgi:hypothetical protein